MELEVAFTHLFIVHRLPFLSKLPVYCEKPLDDVVGAFVAKQHILLNYWENQVVLRKFDVKSGFKRCTIDIYGEKTKKYVSFNCFQHDISVLLQVEKFC